jgi:hypothetical protein
MSLTLALAAGLSFPALAQPADLFREGVRLYSHGEYRQSIEALERAARSTTDPKQLGQTYLYLGFNHAVLGEQADAERALAAALQQDPDIEPDPRRFNRDLLELFRRAQARLGLLRVEGARAGAVLIIDGKIRGGLPARVRLSAGSHRLEIRVGSVACARAVTVSPGQRLVVRCAPGEPPPASTTAPSEPAMEVEEEPVPEPPSFWRRRRIWTWVGAGSAVAVAGAGLGVWLWARSTRDNEWAPLLAQGTQGARQYTAQQIDQLRDIKNSIDARTTSASVLFGVAGGLAVTSVVLLLFEGRPRVESGRTASSIRWGVIPLRGGTGALLTGQFE